MRIARLVPALVCVGLSCQSATQATLRLHTDVPFAGDLQVGVYAKGATGAEAVLSETNGPWNDDGIIGSLVATPPSDRGRDVRLSVRAVLSRGRLPASCHRGDMRGCIETSREVSFLEHQGLNLPMGLYAACEGVACDDGQTCNSLGKCVASTLEASTCTAASGCILPGDPPTPPGVRRPPNNVATEAGASSEPPPERPQLAFRDTDSRKGSVEGQLAVTAAASGPTPEGLALRWTDEQGRALVGAPEFFAEGTSLRHVFLRGSGAPAEFFAASAYIRDRKGNVLWSAPTIARADNHPRQFDVGKGLGDEFLDFLTPFYDNVANRVGVAGLDVSDRPVLWLCDPKGTACSRTDLGVGLGVATGIAGANIVPLGGSRKLVISLRRQIPSQPLLLLVCETDGTQCAQSDLSARLGIGEVVALDQTAHNSTLYFATVDKATKHGFVYACPNVHLSASDAGPCIRAMDLGPRQVDNVQVAASSSRLFLSTFDSSDAGAGVIALYQCTLQSGKCGSIRRSAPQAPGSAASTPPGLVVNPATDEPWVLPWGEDTLQHIYRCGDADPSALCTPVLRTAPGIFSGRTAGAFESPTSLAVAVRGSSGLRFGRCAATASTPCEDIYVGGGTGKVGPQGQLVQCTLDTKACTRITTELQVMSVAIDQGRNVAWLATVNAAYTRVRFLRCGLAAGTCETVLDSGDLASAIPAVTMDESNDRVVFAARSVEWFGRPALVVLDRY